MVNKINAIIACFVGLLILLIFSFFNSSKPSFTGKDESADVEISLGYLTGSQSMPILIAKEKGYYRDSRLTVKVVDLGRYRGQENTLIGSGVLDCSNTSKINAINAVSNGIQIKILTSLAQREGNPVLIPIAKKSSGIRTMTDVKGKTFGFRKGGNPDFLISNLLEKYGIPKNQINIVELSEPEAIPGFRSGKIDIYVADILTIEEIRQDIPINILASSAEVMPNSFSDSLVCREEFIKAHTNTVKKFLEATYRASRFINDNPKNAKELLETLDVSPTWQKINFPLYALNPQYAGDGISEISGWLNKEGIIKQTIDPSQIVYQLL